jgi:hypothetical protein
MGRGGVAVFRGAGEALREDARAAPTMALERDSPVMCFASRLTDSRW